MEIDGLRTSVVTLSHEARPVYHVRPLQDSRWASFLQRHPRSSIFHSVEWLEALRQTYGYEPIALTTSSPKDDLQNAVVLCGVNSWLTGRRLVSLPFSDHCDLLTDAQEDLIAILSTLEKQLYRDTLQYVEIRPICPPDPEILAHASTHSCCLHQIDLRPDIDTLFRTCHKDSTQRKIHRAEREGLTYEEGTTPFLLGIFCDLLLLTRRRHRLPPQPKRWFQNLIGNFGSALKIRVAFKKERPVAAILTLRFKDTLVYKFGCSDARFHRLGGMHLLLWRSIQDAKLLGLRKFDLGRTEWENTGLITFKDRWGAARCELTYSRLLRSPQSRGSYKAAGADWKERAARNIFPRLPDYLLRAVGDLVYRHIG
jgi:CelD/BcsL family acetyltransferase involved in cellulose biosynthesis